MTTEIITNNDALDTDVNQQLKELILPRMTVAGSYPTAIKGFCLHRRDTLHKQELCFNGPIIAATIQGFKRTIVGTEEYRYGAGYSIVAGVDMPTMSHIMEASTQKPYLVVSLDLDSHLTAQLLSELPKERLQKKSFNRIIVAKTDQSILSAFLRLTKLLDKPEQIPFLAPLIIKEIHLRLLLSEQGEQLITINTLGSQSNKIFRAIHQLRENITHSIDVNEIASGLNMAPSTFRKHFKHITSMSPTQYHKYLRLYEAQRLMLVENSDVTSAAQSVGYESAIQFNKEYKRLFGSAPLKNINQIRE